MKELAQSVFFEQFKPKEIQHYDASAVSKNIDFDCVLHFAPQGHDPRGEQTVIESCTKRQNCVNGRVRQNTL